MKGFAIEELIALAVGIGIVWYALKKTSEPASNSLTTVQLPSNAVPMIDYVAGQ